MRCVVDTNVFVSAVILPGSIPRQAVSRVLNREILLACEPTMNALKEVLFRPKLDHYVSGKLRAHFISQLESVAEFVPIIQVIRECRHPKDDKFLELVLNGRGNVIITGDKALLEMNPWRGIAVLSPADYLKVSFAS